MNAITNDAEMIIDGQVPYSINVTIKGNSPLLLHAWSNVSVLEKSKAKKGSVTKKTDDVESYVRRNDESIICIPAEYLRQAIILASKNQSDPRSPRKSMMDLTKASIVSLHELSPITSATDNQEALTWDYLDMRRVVIQRSSITRSRPAFKPGWRANFGIMVLVPEYFDENLMYKLIADAGRFCGIGDFRPTNGRFDIIEFDRQII